MLTVNKWAKSNNTRDPWMEMRRFVESTDKIGSIKTKPNSHTDIYTTVAFVINESQWVQISKKIFKHKKQKMFLKQQQHHLSKTFSIHVSERMWM